MRLAASLLFVAVAAMAQNSAKPSDNSSDSAQSQPDTNKPAYPVQQGNGKPADGAARPEKGYTPDEHNSSESPGKSPITTKRTPTKKKHKATPRTGRPDNRPPQTPQEAEPHSNPK